jgi:hypothetical protein
MPEATTARDYVTAPCMHDADDRREIGVAA